jgi:ABC-type nitrate/sulfonate/bicarbonate transport system permease component
MTPASPRANRMLQGAMVFLRRLHLYLGCLFAPALIFFAVSGSWQLYRLQDSAKDGSYVAPRPLQVLSAVHTNSHLPPKRASEYTPLRTFSLAAAVGLVVTTLLGVVMAFRLSQSFMAPVLCLTAGIAMPAVLLWIYR